MCMSIYQYTSLSSGGHDAAEHAGDGYIYIYTYTYIHTYTICVYITYNAIYQDM